MKKILLIVVPILFLSIAYGLKTFQPEVDKRRAPPQTSLLVETMTVEAMDVALEIPSLGKVRPRTRSTLLPQVSGEIIEISPNFREGGFFEKDEALLRIDQRDYKAQLAISESNLLEAELALSEEEAKSKQALANWKRLQSNSNAAPELVLRKPQLAAVKARVQSAKAQLDQAKLNLERTVIKAPYAGRVLNKHVDVGQVVAPSTNLAELFAIDYLEVRLPVKSHELSYLALPEHYRHGVTKSDRELSVITILNRFGQKEEYWQAKLVRTEGAIDEQSRQLYVIAQIDDPYGLDSEGKRPLKIGQYVTALIEGKEIQQAILIPNKAIYQDSYVYLLKDGELHRRSINVEWQNERNALIASGLNHGDEVVLTSLGQVTSGTKATRIEQDAAVKGKPAQSLPL